MRPPEKTEDLKLKVVVCSRCGPPLSMEVALELDNVRKKADRLMIELVKRPEILEVLLNALKDLEYKEF